MLFDNPLRPPAQVTRRKSVPRWILFLLLIAVASSSANAQKPLTSYGEWVGMGIGPVAPFDGINSNLSYSFQKSDTPIQIALDYAGDFPLFGGKPAFYATALSASVGQRTFGAYYLLAQFVGVSIVYHKKEREVYLEEGVLGEEAVRRVSPGLAASAQFYVKPLAFAIPEVGVGVELFANLNFVRSFYGFRLSLLLHNTI